MQGNQNPTDDQKREANSLKDEGNKFFTQGKYAEAVEKFTAAIELDGTNHIFFSNRSGANLGLGNHTAAQEDARECIRINPTWAKGHSRLGAACMAAKDYSGAIAAYAAGIPHDPTNASLTEGIQAAQAALTAPAADTTVKEVTEKVSEMNVEEKEKVLEVAKEIIGIDLGTTNSCVAVWQGEQVEVIANSEGARTTPSVVAFTDTERLIGAAAMSQSASNPSNTVFGAKRFIGRSIKEKTIMDEVKRLPFKVVPAEDGANPLFEVTYRGTTRTFSPQEISAMVLTKMKQTAEDYLGKKVAKAVVTVPAYFNDAQRNATKTAGVIAQLEVSRIINEPTAAAIAYGLDKKLTEMTSGASSPGYVLIFDLGGGTFDVSLLSIEEGIFEVKATGGDTQLGGEDFDTALQDFALSEFRKRHSKALKDLRDADPSAADPSTNKRAIRRLRTACERVKRHLSISTQATIEVENFFEGLDLNVVITRAKFESLNQKFFKRCIDTVKQVLTDAKARPRDVAEIVLVGGSTRIPKVQDMLSEFFDGKELCKSINPDEAVAVGAAIQGAVLSGDQSSATQALVLVDVAPLSLGIELEGRVMAVLIKRNTPIPVRKSRTFTTTDDYQTEVKVNVYEGERSIVDSNNLLGSFTISGIQIAKRGVPQIDVTFNIDANGMLHVTARDQVTKANAEITITNTVGHNSPEEIERLVAEAERMKKEDDKIMARVEARNELESFLYMVKSDLDQYNDEALSTLVAETVSWLDEKDEEGPATVDVSEFEEKRKALETQFDRVTREAQRAQEQAQRGRGQRRR